MTAHPAFCMWHTSISPEFPDRTWNIPAHRHIYGTIRSSADGVLTADALLEGFGFKAARNVGGGYYARQIWLTRVS